MPPPATATRDRLIQQAMALFGVQGFRATTVVQIEEAAGLSPGAGGLYHHFRSKEELLEAGVDRHLDRLRALQDIREVVGPLPDRCAELGMLARYALQVVDDSLPVLRLIATEQVQRPAALGRALDSGLALLRHELSGWLVDLAPEVGGDVLAPVAAVAVEALIARRLHPALFGDREGSVDDDAFVAEWVALVGGRLDELERPEPRRRRRAADLGAADGRAGN